MLGELTLVVLVAQKFFEVLRQGALTEGEGSVKLTSLC
jgi:hypothetical protein